MREQVCHLVKVRRAAGVLAALSISTALLSAQIPGRNVNMVSGADWPNGDPFLQRQNEPSLAASTRNPLHLLAGANDYRTVDLPGVKGAAETGDAWLGVFKSLDGGTRWSSTLLPGYPQDRSSEGKRSPLYGYQAGADPVVRPGSNGLFYFSGIVFDRTENGKSQVFVARYIDNNNKEAGDPIQYLGAATVARDTGRTGDFIDKPWLAVDVPRAGAPTCRVEAPGTSGKAQVIPAGAVYVAYTVIRGEGANITGTIMFSRSLDCGVTWSAPVAISQPSDKINQGATIAVDPTTGVVYIAWRKFGLGVENDAIVVTRAQPGSTRFEKPRALREFYAGRELGQLIRFLVGNRRNRAPSTEPASHVDPQIAPFDQGTLADRFRTNSYPTMAVDGQSRVYIAWAERGFRMQAPGAQQDASIVMTTGVNGGDWTAPSAVDLHQDPGHQFMPSLAFGGGKLMLVYYDLREDVSGFFNSWVDETSAIFFARRRHTIDVRATQADPAAVPQFAPSVRVSEYLRGSRPRSRIIEQLQFNPPNLPLFQLGEVPFMGDYVDLAPAPAMVQDASGQWRFNTTPSRSPVFHVAWTDNRDVRPPPDGDWSRYTPPSGTALTSTFDPTKAVEPCSPGRAGMRNQNVYTSRITAGLLAGSPGNAKPLHPDLPRAFVVFAQNTTSTTKAFRLTITEQPAGGRASFTQLERDGLLTFVDVLVPARSTVSKTLFATSSNPQAKIPVSVEEIAAVNAPAPLPDGLASIVMLNPDISNPDISNPDISNPDISNPDISNPDISNAEVYNPDISNPDISNPDISNPDISNPDISNPDISNVVVLNPDISNPDISNPDISNPDISNPDISNPDISNPDISNGSITDVTWTVTNRGNTTASYDLNLLTSAAVPGSIKTQLIVHKAYKTPVSDGCTLKYQTHTVLVTNIVNPVTNPDISNASLWLEPGASGRITLRVVDPDPRDNETFNPLAGDTAITPEVKAEAINTSQLTEPDPEPPSATPPSVTSTTLSVLAQPTSGVLAQPLGLFRVQVLRTVDGVTTPLANASVAAGILVNPGGGQLGGQSTVLTDPSGFADFTTLAIDRTGQGYQLAFTAASAGAVPVSSASFSIAAPAADPTQNVFVVTSTADSGSGTLRQAILDANATANGVGGPDIITFGFRVTDVHTIVLASPLPHITGPVIIDGTSQAGYNPLVGQPRIHVAGTGADGFHGLVFVGGAANSAVRGLALTGFGAATTLNTTAAIRVSAPSVTVAGNWVGIAPDGTPAGNHTGIFVIGAVDATIGGTGGAGTRNVIAAGRTGIFALQSTGTTIRGNYIGTAPDGLTPHGHVAFGITLQGPQMIDTVIGGPLPPGGYFGTGSPANLISANALAGISLLDTAVVGGPSGGPTNTQILGNVIGLAADGSDTGNAGAGILVRSAPGTQVGAPGAGNVISGNGSLSPFATGAGIRVQQGPSGPVGVVPVIQSNVIGMDPSGTVARPNVYEGIILNQPATIGGTGPGQGNLIAGNGHAPTASGTGILLLGGSGGSIVQGNVIGLSAVGVALGNGYSGITVSGPAGSSLIGGSVPGARNVISGNPNAGVAIYATAAAVAATVRGNYIGTAVSGALAGVGNGAEGIRIESGTGHMVGGPDAADGNLIAGNGAAGVAVQGPVMQVDIRSNSILANGGLGIDLGAPGVLANDPGDGDVGANGLQNYPLLSAVGGSPGTLRVTLNSQPGTYVVQVFGNDTCDPSGHGEGQQLVKETTLTITGETAVVDLPDGIVPGLELTATATDAQGNTSEFSPCVAFTQQELLVSQNLGAGAYSASQTAGGSSPSFAFDGNLVNNWNAGWWPLQWIEVDLQQARALGRIRLHVEQSPAGETTHEVWISNNPIGASLGGATLAHVFTGPTASGQVLEVVWDPTETARYVQVRTTVSPSWVAWREVQIFAIVNTP